MPCPVGKYMVCVCTVVLSLSVSIPSIAAATSSTAATKYEVRSGDTLYAIAKKVGVSVDELVRLNSLRDPSALKPGMQLVLRVATPASPQTSAVPKAPLTQKTTQVVTSIAKSTTVSKPTATVPTKSVTAKPTTYSVQSGDTLWGISKKLGISTADLMKFNGLREDSILRPGSTLKLTQQAVVANTATPTTTVKPTTASPASPKPVLPIPTPRVVTPVGTVVVPLPLVTDATHSAPTAEKKTVAPAQKNNDTNAKLDPQWATNLRQATGITESDIDPKTAAKGAEQLVPKANTDSKAVVPLAVATDAERAREALGRLKGGISGNVSWPVTGRLTSPFGRRWGRMHEGIDLGVPEGTPVRVAADGVVTFSGWSGGYGKLVVVNHGQGWETYYGHNSDLRVTVGQTVLKGEVIARSGNTGNTTGPHVHFEIRQDGAPLDPLRFLK